MAEEGKVGRDQVLTRVLNLVTEAMDLLDAHGVDPQAAAYLALAHQQVRKSLSSD